MQGLKGNMLVMTKPIGNRDCEKIMQILEQKNTISETLKKKITE